MKKRARTKHTPRAEKTRARLVDAAIDEFAEFGFHNSKISNIVARAGVTQPTFYFYFDTKEAIHEYLVERVRMELTGLIETARIPATTPASDVMDKLRNAIEVFLKYFEENPKLAPIGYFDGIKSSAIREEIVALVSRNIAFEQGAGYCRPELDPVFMSHCYNGSLERLIRVYLLSGQYDAHALAEKVANLYGYGSVPKSFFDSTAGEHNNLKS
ncbi:TetR/AcrR family transcriptional regulator [Kordiimonas pumila]|uniref:TetR/AcrR family transcriptional regulator n=1 Tax=Kordiimonas pumila TaxID=2161677 RepID=A0ABV7D786_9PROT|nr:TetR/AcrR family transcriptional regulator [Kordiimonas pumila]